MVRWLHSLCLWFFWHQEEGGDGSSVTVVEVDRDGVDGACPPIFGGDITLCT